MEFFLVGDKEKHSQGAGTESSPGGRSGPQLARGFSALIANLGNIVDLCSPLVAYPQKPISESKLLLPQGSDFFSYVNEAHALLLQALSWSMEGTYPHPAMGIGGISSCQFSQGEHGCCHTLLWMWFACHLP